MISKVEVPLSKIKITGLLIGALFFIVAGVLIAISSEIFVTRRLKNAEFIRIAGIIATCFFGFILVFIIKKLADNRIGLIIDHSGITDNTNATSVGLIEWGDITGIGKIQFFSSRMLVIHTSTPEKYIKRATNSISRKAMRMNLKMYGSPISIVSNSLKISFDDLEKLITSEFEKRKAT